MSGARDAGSESPLPLAPSMMGPAVDDLQRRLHGLGRDLGSDQTGSFGPGTETAVRSLQQDRGLPDTGVVDRATWQALVEAGYHLGDRPLYHHRPMLRGDDVSDLQFRLGSLGFDAGWVDGIFGPDTERALKDFQRNAGVPTDGIAGFSTIAELDRLGAKSARSEPVVRVREREHLRRRAGAGLVGQRVVIGEVGTLGALADATGRSLRHAGADVLTLHDPDLSDQAQAANRFTGDVYVGLTSRRAPGCELRFFSTDNFASFGGQKLASDLAVTLADILPDGPVVVAGSRTAVLRETRMPAIWCELGPVAAVVRQHGAVADAITDTLRRSGDDVDDPEPHHPENEASTAQPSTS
ncbi:MAG: peptidoglycan-binding protein [Acidimicrobiales bacterium]